MARLVETKLVDDLDGSTADETVSFGLDGKTYEIDLSSDNAAELRDSLTAFIVNARKVGRIGRPASRSRNPETPKARAWLNDNGYDVGERGRIPDDLLEIYRAKGASS